MSDPESVTQWIARLKAGSPDAARALWERYFQRLVQRAQRKLAAVPRRAADEEDVVLSAFDSFCRAAAKGRFPRLDDRDDLWQLLLVLTDRKAHDLAQHERRQKRGGGKVLDEAALRGDGELAAAPLAQLVGQEPDPEFAALVGEEYRRLLAALGDAELQRLAVCKMQGYTVEEIAAQLGLVPRTVQRRLRLIRQIWQREVQP
jgi:DNA-directed RNA polymerase specialized sigma24 family protein